MKERSLTLQILLTLIPIVLSLAITALLIMAVNADPRAVFEKVWEGAFRDTRSFAQVINFWIPLTLVSMGLIVTFTAGLWNIGVEGQMMMGAVAASWAALYVPLPSVIAIPFEIILAMAGGALWAALVALLKTRLGVHEIFGGVGLNALANVISIYLISGPWQPPQGGSVHATDQFPESAVLSPISADFQVSLLALVIVLASIVAIILALRGTRWGLQLKATGKNARSALLLGVPTERSAVTAMVVGGALAGIAGSYRVLFTYGSLRPLVSGGIGFLGLLVVLLIANRALWVPFVTFAFAAILGGSTRLKVALQLDQSLAGVLQGFLVLAVLLFNGVRQRLQERTRITEDTPAEAGFKPISTTTAEAITHE
jgi:simple sugar transport system permease protein